LTLRTLLAYLDDTLEPSQAKLIGQKVAESDTAQELIARIKQVTRRRRITTPPPSGPGGKIDANTIAEYLDNAVSAEQLAEVEQICLASDVHLAEVAACHQILTLVLGEPALVPPTAKQRMYGLVKGPEAIPFRKPPVRNEPIREVIEESKETDETLRLGLPAYRRKGSWSQRLLLVGGGLLVACLLVLAIIQVLHPLQGGGGRERPTVPVAQSISREKEDEKPEVKDKATTPDKKGEVEPDKKGDTKPPQKPETKQPPETPDKKGSDSGTKPKDTAIAKVPYAPPSTKQVAGWATYIPPTTNEKSILLQAQGDRSVWKRLGVRYPDIKTARRLVSLPGARSKVEAKSGIQLTLWGYLPELYPDPRLPALLESVVEFHDNEQKGIDLDMTFYRGRIVIINAGREGPARVRLRFENPTVPASSDDTLDKKADTSAAVAREFFDIVLKERGAEVLLDRWSFFPSSERFYKDRTDSNRQGPVAGMVIWGQGGDVTLKFNDLDFDLDSRPGQGPPFVAWNSGEGRPKASRMEKLPPWISTNPPLPEGIDPKQAEALMKMRSDMLRALEDLSTSMSDKSVGVALTEATESPDSARRRYAVRSFAALDDLPSLMDALDQIKYGDVRQEAIKALQMWIASSRDAEYKLYDYLKTKYKTAESTMIMDLLHPTPYSPEAMSRPETYEALIGKLTNDSMVIRELAATYLYTLVPSGRNIPYSAVHDDMVRRQAQERWYKLIPPGRLPPAPKKTN
jgi:hypothetical protein